MALTVAASAVLSACSPTPGGSPLAVPATSTTSTPTATAPTPVSMRTTAAAPAPTTPAAAETSAPPPAPSTSARALLARLEVKGRAPRTGYDRELFGQTWADTDRNGCDTRNDVLHRDLEEVVVRPGTNGCVVLSGVLPDPFSGRHIPFTRGEATSSLVQVDHVVALSDAWQKGAQQWSPQRRVAFANDPLNLLAVDGRLNSQKGDGDAATWLPPATGLRCDYVARQVAVKATYGAWVTEAERGAMAAVLAGCPDHPAPTSASATESTVGAAAPPPPVVVAPAVPVEVPAPGCDPAYPSVCLAPREQGGDVDCGDVAATGFPALAPDPHALDRDGDGIACDAG